MKISLGTVSFLRVLQLKIMSCAIVINNTGFFFPPYLIKLLLLPQGREREKMITWIWLNTYVACRFQLECLQLVLSLTLMYLTVGKKRGCSGEIGSGFCVSVIGKLS